MDLRELLNDRKTLPELLDIPVAYCSTCDETGPVIVSPVDIDNISPDGESMVVIYCPGCDQIINLDRDIEITWYDESELHKATGWKVSRTGDAVDD